MPNNQMKIGTIKSFVRKGDRVTVYFANGKSDRFIAQNDITSREVMVMGDRAFSQDAGQVKLVTTTRLFKSRNNYEEGGRYPYLSVFINDQDQLVVTYNGSQRILGDIPFNQLTSVNLNHQGNGIFTGVVLSKNKEQIAIFSNKKIKLVITIPPLENIPNRDRNWMAATNNKLSGNVVWNISYPPTVNFRFYLSPQTYPAIQNEIEDSYSAGNGLNIGSAASFPNWNNIGASFPPGYRYNTSNTYSYTDSRTVLNETPGGYTNKTLAWNYQTGPTVYLYFISLRESPGSALFFINSLFSPTNLTNSFNTEISSNWEGVAIIPIYDSLTSVYPDDFFPEQPVRNLEIKITRKGNARNIVNETSNFNISVDNSAQYLLNGNSAFNYERFVEEIRERIVPIRVNDYQSAEDKDFLERQLNIVIQQTATATNSRFSSIAGTTMTSNYQENFKNSYISNSIPFIFNCGELGIYWHFAESFEDTYNLTFIALNDAKPLFQYGTAVNSPPFPIPNKPGAVVNSIGTDYYRNGNNRESKESYTKQERSSYNTYKIAYLNKPVITAIAGYAAICSFNQSKKIYDFYLDVTSDQNITIDVTYQRYTNVYYQRIQTETNSGGFAEVSQANTTFQKKTLNVNDIRNFDFNNQHVVLKTTYQSKIYLALVLIESTVYTETIDNNINFRQFDYQNITKLNGKILAVKEIKSFFTTSSFVFTVDGCAIFQFLDPFRTNVIKNESTDKVYLASTMTFPVTEKETQALLFELRDNGFTFVAVVGGDVSDVDRSPSKVPVGSPLTAYDDHADKWIKYWDRPPASFW
jgi:hypothetical protein